VNPHIDLPQKKILKSRNQARLKKANRANKQTLSKYLRTDGPFVNVTVQGPDDGFKPPNWLLTNVMAVAGMTVPTPQKPPVVFRMDEEAAQQNTNLLQEHGVDFDRFLRGQAETTMAYGSEFCPLGQLKLVLGNHSLFPELEKILTQGMDYRFATTITEKQRVEETTAMMKQGNRKIGGEGRGTSGQSFEQGRPTWLLATYHGRRHP
jgi:hypothetical protein